MKVADVVRGKGHGVVIIHPDASVGTAAKMMRARHIGALVVSRDGRVVDGIISERDIVYGLADDPTLMSERVATAMSPHVFTATADDTLAHVMAVMTRERCRHVALVRNGELDGIVSIGDIVKARLEELDLESRVLRDVVLAAR